MYDHPMQEQRSPFFLLSFILHLLLLYLCYQLISYHKTSQNAAKSPPNMLNQPIDDEPAEMRAKQSAFGAPVVFQDMPEFTPMDTADNADDQDGQQNEPVMQHAEPIPEQAENDTPEQPLEHNAEQSLEVPTDPSPQHIAKAYEATEHTEGEQQEHQKTPQQKKVPALTKEQLITQRMRKRRTSDAGQKVAAPTSKKFTFADLANGFLENLKNGGQDEINQRGNPNRRPTYKDLKYVSYKQKLAWHLQAAFKRAAGADFMVPAPERSKLVCTIAVAKNGALQDVRVRTSTKHLELDTYILQAVRDAFPIPPIPKHWEKETLVMDWSFSNIHPKHGTYHITF